MTRSILVFALLIAALPAYGQQPARVAFAFEGKSTNHNVGQVLSERAASRAWQDSVEVFLDQTLEEGSVRRVEKEEPADYRVSVIAVPLMLEGKATGLTVYSLAFFQLGSFNSWKYVSHSGGYSLGAKLAADYLAAFTNAQITALKQVRR